MIKQLVLTAALLFLAMTPALAQQRQGTEIERAEAYFANLKTVKSRFIQTNTDGTQSRGTFYLNRPGKLRFEYDPPNKDFVVADGLFIYFYDGEMKQQTNAPISQTLADFLLRKELKLSGDLKVTKIMKAGRYIQITMIQRESPKAGELTLGFTQGAKYQLKKWRIKDSVGNITETELFDVQTDIKLPSSLFAYHDPVAKGVNK